MGEFNNTTGTESVESPYRRSKDKDGDRNTEPRSNMLISPIYCFCEHSVVLEWPVLVQQPGPELLVLGRPVPAKKE